MPDRGLQAVPRGLDRDLTTCLQALRTEILRLSGMVRGSENSRAVRASEAVPFRVGAGSSSSGVDVGAIASQILRDGAVTERKLADRAVSNRKLANNAVDVRVIAPGAVENTALAEHCVSTGKIQDGAVSGSKLATGAVNTVTLAEGCVSSGKLAKGAVSSAHVVSGAVTTDKLAQGAVGTTALAEQAVTAGKLAKGAVGAEQIASACITADKIAQGVIPVVPEPPVLPVWVTGTAMDGESVAIPGVWETTPLVMLTWFETVAVETHIIDEEGVETMLHTASAGAVHLYELLDETAEGEPIHTGQWVFEAQGKVSWVAVCR